MLQQRLNCKNDEHVYPIPWLKQQRYSSSRLCERPNYIPHPTPRNAVRSEWHESYITQLIDIYTIINNVMKERYPNNKIKWNSNNKIFHNLSQLIYNTSSKHI
jgi:hypothetical protein